VGGKLLIFNSVDSRFFLALPLSPIHLLIEIQSRFALLSKNGRSFRRQIGFSLTCGYLIAAFGFKWCRAYFLCRGWWGLIGANGTWPYFYPNFLFEKK